MLLIIACVCSFICIAALLTGLLYASPRPSLAQRLTALQAVRDEDLPLDRRLGHGFFARIVAPTLSRLGHVIERLTPGGATGVARAKLERAGSPLGITAAQFMALRALSACAFAFAAVSVYRLGYFDGILNPLFAGGTMAAGLLIPDWALQFCINRRERVMRKELPDMLDLLVASTEAGLGLDQAIREVEGRKRGPLSDEFGRVLKEINLGKTRAEAWRDLTQRTGLDDLRSFASAIYQAEQLGASIANVLRTQSDTLRSRRALKLRELAAKLPTKMLFPLVFFIFPALFVVFLGPALISIYKALRIM